MLYGLAREIARALQIEIPTRESFREETYFQYGFLPRVYEVLDGERLLVLVDEFDVLGGEEVADGSAYNLLFTYLQDLLIDEQSHLTFVFIVGRRIDELPSRIKATFKSAQCKRISVLDRDSAERLIREPASNEVEFDDSAVARLLELTAGHPYFLQLLCYELFERASRSDQRRVSAADIDDELLETAMEMGMGGLSWFWDEFPPAERFILSAIAHITKDRPQATMTQIRRTLEEHGVRLQGMEISTAPTVLTDWEIIQSAGRSTFRFRVEFLRRWIDSKHSLDEAKRELEQVSARAVASYEAGRRSHADGDIDLAIEHYKRALAANPNHARAQLGLAQSLYERGRTEAACDAFEHAFRLDPESAQDGLIASHSDMGQAFEKTERFDSARLHYQRILDLTPGDQGILQRMRDAWRATASMHLGKGRPEKAMQSYREALRYAPDDAQILQSLASLEARHEESDFRERRRQQMERVALEAKLEGEESRRHLFQNRAKGSLVIMLGMACLVAFAGPIFLAWRNEILFSPDLRTVILMSTSALYICFALLNQRLT